MGNDGFNIAVILYKLVAAAKFCSVILLLISISVHTMPVRQKHDETRLACVVNVKCFMNLHLDFLATCKRSLEPVYMSFFQLNMCCMLKSSIV